jgi:hypothetical protein
MSRCECLSCAPFHGWKSDRCYRWISVDRMSSEIRASITGHSWRKFLFRCFTNLLSTSFTPQFEILFSDIDASPPDDIDTAYTLHRKPSIEIDDSKIWIKFCGALMIPRLPSVAALTETIESIVPLGIDDCSQYPPPSHISAVGFWERNCWSPFRWQWVPLPEMRTHRYTNSVTSLSRGLEHTQRSGDCMAPEMDLHRDNVVLGIEVASASTEPHPSGGADKLGRSKRQ